MPENNSQNFTVRDLREFISETARPCKCSGNIYPHKKQILRIMQAIKSAALKLPPIKTKLLSEAHLRAIDLGSCGTGWFCSAFAPSIRTTSLTWRTIAVSISIETAWPMSGKIFQTVIKWAYESYSLVYEAVYYKKSWNQSHSQKFMQRHWKLCKHRLRK